MSKPLYSSLGESPISDQRLPDGEVVAPPLFKLGCWGSRTFAKHSKTGPRFKCRHRARQHKLTCAAHNAMEGQARELRERLGAALVGVLEGKG